MPSCNDLYVHLPYPYCTYICPLVKGFIDQLSKLGNAVANLDWYTRLPPKTILASSLSF